MIFKVDPKIPLFEKSEKGVIKPNTLTPRPKMIPTPTKPPKRGTPEEGDGNTKR
ncbi:MAG: hypothetical protein HQK89_12595 [Nitrospirae bacterium]|nr:hypothetical protein [Nitrospirota bacterium]